MNKIVLFAILSIILTSTIVFAIRLPAITAANKFSYKSMLQNYFHNVNYGYGIGLNNDNYLIARWQIVNARTLNVSEIKNIVSSSNATDWPQLRQEIQNALQTEANVVKKGRIRIGNTTYVMTNVQVNNQTLIADINEMPAYSTCAQQNISAEDCENNVQKIGDISIARKTEAIQSNGADPRVWAGTLDFNNVAYTFVSFVYPR